ncbi:MAG: ABC transporter substrate-binding protein [Mariprofundaceae bacterium]|nr:ABC transporter substrate-binding protein [Mariprofundaceae bacterium]
MKTFLMVSLLVLLPAQGMADDAAAGHEASPKQVVETAVGGVIDVLKARKDQTALSSEDRDAVRKAVEGYFDFPEMAKRALGKAWKKMTDVQKDEYIATFRELLERSYGNRLSDYHDQTVEFKDAKVKKRIAIVDSDVVDADKRTPVRYKLVHKKVGWRVYDIKVEGISMISTYRTDFTAAVNKDGLDGFLNGLKERVAGLQEQDQG